MNETRGYNVFTKQLRRALVLDGGVVLWLNGNCYGAKSFNLAARTVRRTRFDPRKRDPRLELHDEESQTQIEMPIMRDPTQEG